MSEHSKYYDDADRNKPLSGAAAVNKEQVLQTLLDAANGEIGALTAECERLAGMVNGAVAGSVDRNAVALDDALNTVLWLERRLPQGYGKVPHVTRTIASLHNALKSAAPAKPEPAVEGDDLNWLLSDMDAMKWANEFCKRNPSMDHGLMLTWFACAIMTGFDEANRRAAPVAQPLAPSEAVDLCPTCGGSKVDPGGLRMCRDCAQPLAGQDGRAVTEAAQKVVDAYTNYEVPFSQVTPLIKALSLALAAQPLTGQDVRAPTEPVPVCGDNEVLPARFVGCTEQIKSWAEAYRCTHCNAVLHRECAEKHFKNDNVLTNSQIDSMTSEELRKVRLAAPSPVNPKQEQ